MFGNKFGSLNSTWELSRRPCIFFFFSNHHHNHKHNHNHNHKECICHELSITVLLIFTIRWIDSIRWKWKTEITFFSNSSDQHFGYPLHWLEIILNCLAPEFSFLLFDCRLYQKHFAPSLMKSFHSKRRNEAWPDLCKTLGNKVDRIQALAAQKYKTLPINRNFCTKEVFMRER